MRASDVLLFGWRALYGYRTRTVFMLIAMSIGVAAVMMLTALGEGAQRYVRNEFASLGTNLVIILPGRSETSGVGLGTIMGVTPRDLTLADAKALTQHPAVKRVAPINVGAAEASWQNRKREVTVLGSTNEILEVRHWRMERGKFLPKGDWDRASSVCVLGAKIRDELFGAHSAIGQWVRLGENRYRVIGVMASEGRSIGVDVEEVVIIPVASAQSLFNVPSLFRVLIEARSHTSIPRVIDFAKETIKQRHQGEEDITVVTQDAVLSTFDRILGALTYSIAGIAAISLAVAGILIMNVMLIAVSQRTSEIGLLKALGASRHTILLLILIEALLLSVVGGLLGLGIGQLGSWGLRAAIPELQAYPPNWAMLASVMVAVVTGVLFSLLPASKASRLDPVMALSRH
ncbi:MAG TPA: ABC transporter permease [Gammaproteobacteria bacterium]|jgi:putative ABC transport system permease protein